MDCSLSGSSVHGIFQARILEWVAMPSSRGSSQPRDQTCVYYVSCIGRWVFFTTSATWEAQYQCLNITKSEREYPHLLELTFVTKLDAEDLCNQVLKSKV